MNENIDIFDQLGSEDLSSVDTSMPILNPGLYSFTIKNMERQVWKSGEGSSLRIDLALNDEAVDITNERAISPGYTVIDRISLVAKGAYDPKVNVARFLEAIGMKDQPFDSSFQSYIGQEVMVKTKVESGGTDYPDRPAVASYVKSN